jgi:hypothetical protein
MYDVCMSYVLCLMLGFMQCAVSVLFVIVHVSVAVVVVLCLCFMG